VPLLRNFTRDLRLGVGSIQKVMQASLSWSFFLIGQPYLSDVWLDVDVRMDTKRHMFQRDSTNSSKYSSRLHSDHYLFICLFWGGGEGGEGL
jgi:hypothetical protein